MSFSVIKTPLFEDLNSTAVVMSAFFDATTKDGITNYDEVEDDYRDRVVVERQKVGASL